MSEGSSINRGVHWSQYARWIGKVTLDTLNGSMVFFFKQKTAYEISECDWSSEVCSSDLKQKTAYEISECDWSSDVCSSDRSEEHTSELQSHSEISYAVFCLRSEERRVGKEC